MTGARGPSLILSSLLHCYLEGKAIPFLAQTIPKAFPLDSTQQLERKHKPDHIIIMPKTLPRLPITLWYNPKSSYGLWGSVPSGPCLPFTTLCRLELEFLNDYASVTSPLLVSWMYQTLSHSRGLQRLVYCLDYSVLKAPYLMVNSYWFFWSLIKWPEVIKSSWPYSWFMSGPQFLSLTHPLL